MSIADEISKLDELHKKGLITDVEFDQQKTSLLGAKVGVDRHRRITVLKWADVPLQSKMWFQCLLTLLIIPIGLIFMIFFPSYKKIKGRVVQVGTGEKTFFVLLWVFLWTLVILG